MGVLISVTKPENAALERVRVRGKLARNADGQIFIRGFEPPDQGIENSLCDVELDEEIEHERKWVQVKGLTGIENLASPWVSITGLINHGCTSGSAKPRVLDCVVHSQPRPDELMYEQMQFPVGDYAPLELSDAALEDRVTTARECIDRDITRHVDELEKFAATVDCDGLIDGDAPFGAGYIGGVGFCVHYQVPIVTDELREYLKFVNAKVALIPTVQRREARKGIESAVPW